MLGGARTPGAAARCGETRRVPGRAAEPERCEGSSKPTPASGPLPGAGTAAAASVPRAVRQREDAARLRAENKEVDEAGERERAGQEERGGVGEDASRERGEQALRGPAAAGQARPSLPGRGRGSSRCRGRGARTGYRKCLPASSYPAENPKSGFPLEREANSVRRGADAEFQSQHDHPFVL